MASPLVAVASATRAAQLAELGRRVFCLTVDVNRRAQLLGERALVLTAHDRHGVKPHLRRVLNGEMAQATHAEHRDDVARPRTAVSERVERGDARAHERRRIDGCEIRGQQSDRASRSDHVLGISAVESDAGHLTGLAREEIAASAEIALPTIAAVPPNPHALTPGQPCHTGTHRVDHTRDFVTGNSRIRYARKDSLFDDRIAVADAASLDLDSNPALAWLGHRSVHDLNWPFRLGDLSGSHCRRDSCGGGSSLRVDCGIIVSTSAPCKGVSGRSWRTATALVGGSNLITRINKRQRSRDNCLPVEGRLQYDSLSPEHGRARGERKGCC